VPASKTTAKKAKASKAKASKASASKASASKASASKASASKASASKAKAKKPSASRATTKTSTAKRAGRTTSAMPARPGDLIVIDSAQVGSPARQGEILKVTVGAFSVSYQVRWGDGRETTISPGGGTARIIRS
jgi:hypothetical protein